MFDPSQILLPVQHKRVDSVCLGFDEWVNDCNDSRRIERCYMGAAERARNHKHSVSNLIEG